MVTHGKEPYHWGLIAPRYVDDRGDGSSREEPLLPPEVVTLTNALGISDYTVASIEEAMARYPDCVQDLVDRGARRVCLNGIPISVQLGRPRVLALLEDTHNDFGVPGDTAAEAVVAAMKRQGVGRIAVGSRWAEEVNDAIIRYLADAEIEVLSITSRGQWARQSFDMSFEMGVKQAFELGREAMQAAPQADALFPPGGGLAALGKGHLLPIRDSGRPGTGAEPRRRRDEQHQ